MYTKYEYADDVAFSSSSTLQSITQQLWPQTAVDGGGDNGTTTWTQTIIELILKIYSSGWFARSVEFNCKQRQP